MEVGAWLRYLGLERYEPAFRNSEITAEVLPELTDAGLQELGPRKVLLKAIGSLRAPSGAVSEMRDDIASVPQPEGQPARCPRPTGSHRPQDRGPRRGGLWRGGHRGAAPAEPRHRHSALVTVQ
jgi:hypothetical protein